MPFFKTEISFPLNFAFLWNFLTETYVSDKKSPSIPHVISEIRMSGFIQILHKRWVSWKITPLYLFSSNFFFLDFWEVGWKFTNCSCHNLKLQVSFSLNFASLFSVMRDKFAVLFKLKLYIILTKGANQTVKFQTYDFRKFVP